MPAMILSPSMIIHVDIVFQRSRQRALDPMVGKCEVTWAGPGWNKNNNDDGRDSDDRDDEGDYSFSFICMGLLHSVR